MLGFRPIRTEDQDFLRRLYASTRQEELAAVPWSEEEKAAFLQMQFRAQHTYYKQQFPEAQFDIILQDHHPIGRLYVDRRPEEIRLIDIAFLPEYRGQGIGGRRAANTGQDPRGGLQSRSPSLRPAWVRDGGG